MRFTTRGLNLMFSRNADKEEGTAMSRTAFMKVVGHIVGQSVWKTSNIPAKRLSLDEIIKHTREFFSISHEDFISKRQRAYLEPRMFSALYARSLGYTLVSIGDKLGGKHYASIVHYEKVGNDLLKVDRKFKDRYTDLQFYLQSKQIKTI